MKSVKATDLHDILHATRIRLACLKETARHGADAVLLIMAALNDSTFRCLLARARELDIDAACEVHNNIELKRALNGGAEIIAVNDRDLRTFDVRPEPPASRESGPKA